MTGTAMTEASEFQQIYKLGVVPIPANRPVQRTDQSDLVYRTEDAKLKAVIADIEAKHRDGQPVLVGTTSVEKSELVSKYLTRSGIPHEVLNAKQHDREATIVAEAVRVWPSSPVIDLLAAYEFCGSARAKSRLKISVLRMCKR